MGEKFEQNIYGSDIAVSSRVRLARNINDIPFPARMDAVQGVKVIERVRDTLLKCEEDVCKGMLFHDIQNLDAVDRQVLVEKHLISPELCEGPKNRAVIIDRDEKISIMINEEDHLRIQCIFNGMKLNAAWQLCNSIESLLGRKLEFAFNNNFGYLTCCPTNTGTGMRASIMLHLPALTMSGYIKKILEACGKLGLVVRGIYGENSEAAGNYFQISNQVTLGLTEEEIITSVNNISLQIIEQEIALRKELFLQNPTRFEDKIFRALGILENARLISTEESLRLLSDLRLGVDMKIISGIDMEVLNEIMLNIQPAYLQRNAGRALGHEERDALRAEAIRKKLNVR